MRRIGLAATVLVGPLLVLVVSWAQPAEPMRKVGVLIHAATEAGGSSSFEAALHERGWIKGRNVAVEYRYSGGRPERLTDLATELANLRPDAIVAHTNPAVAAAKAATTTFRSSW